MLRSSLEKIVIFAILFFFFSSVYRVVISTAYGQTTDKVSIVLVGQSGAQTGVHDLPGEFKSRRQVSRRIMCYS